MVWRGYIDESYGKKFFTLSCLMSDSLNWMWFESAWKRCLRSVNKSLKAQGRKQLTRYHAADCSSRTGEFKGWTVDEQIGLTRGLLNVFNKRLSYVVAYSIPLLEFSQQFPNERSPVEKCYGVLLKFVMTEITAQLQDAARKLHGRVKPVKIALIHDRGPYDVILLEAFNSFVSLR